MAWRRPSPLRVAAPGSLWAVWPSSECAGGFWPPWWASPGLPSLAGWRHSAQGPEHWDTHVLWNLPSPLGILPVRLSVPAFFPVFLILCSSLVPTHWPPSAAQGPEAQELEFWAPFHLFTVRLSPPHSLSPANPAPTLLPPVKLTTAAGPGPQVPLSLTGLRQASAG